MLRASDTLKVGAPGPFMAPGGTGVRRAAGSWRRTLRAPSVQSNIVETNVGAYSLLAPAHGHAAHAART
eukprot:2906438-Pleurochrysis_carterae.AAC.1